ncbi:MAG: clan AA aspartic protease [Chloroflexi bacterium]|nr:clan AA aspartic protease [Chloroflexota bacterium]
MTQRIHLSLPPWAVDNVVLLNVRLNDRILIRMLLDTGAKYTIITSAVAGQLGLNLANARQVPVTTATQPEIATLTAIDQVDVHGLVLRQVETAILDLPVALRVDGLLGMSFLKRCRLTADFPQRFLDLETDAS